MTGLVQPFISTVPGSLDSKGRVCIPATYRHILAAQNTAGVYICPSFIDPALVDSVVFNTGMDEDSRHQQLSPRERQILEMVCAGMPLGDIADRLHLSPKTVSTHKMRLMQKLDLRTNADLLKYALRQGLTSH